MITVKTGESAIGVLGTVQGLVSERDVVQREFVRFGPDAVALSISKSMLAGLEDVISGNVQEAPVSTLNEIFAAHLKRFGEVQLPPPSLVQANRLARDGSIPCIPVDLDDEEYESLHIEHVSPMQYFRHIGRLKRLAKRRFKAENPRDFVLEWDFRICRLKGFRLLEEARERSIAGNLVSLLEKHSRILAVVELERERGIVTRLKDIIERG